MAGAAAFAFLAARQARRPVVLAVLGLALFLYGAIVVAYGFNRGAAAIGGGLLTATVLAGVFGWNDLRALWERRARGQAMAPERPRLTLGALWIPIAAVLAAYYALGDFSPASSYAMRWLAAPAVLIAIAGRTYRWAAATAAVVVAVDAAYVGGVSLQAIGTEGPARIAYVIAAVIVVALSAVQVVRLLGRSPLFDPVHLIAVQLAFALVMRWAYYLGSGLGIDPNTYGAGTTATPFRAELPLLAMALAAIGLGMTRPVASAARRLGLAIPRWWHVALALAVANAYILLTYPANVLTYWITPEAYSGIVQILHKTDGSLPYWAALAYALLAGICEESLFRGAIQPRVGIVATAVLFAAIHVQYGLTPILGLVFAAGLTYGLIRRHLNLTTAVIAHAATDTGGFLLAYDVRTNVLWATVVAAAVVADLWRRRSTHPPEIAVSAGSRGTGIS